MMKAVDQGSLALLALTSRATDAEVASLKASEVWRLLAAVEDPSSLLGLDVADVDERVAGSGLAGVRIVRLLETGVGQAVRLEALYERGISALTALDEGYPVRLRERLGNAAPPVLYCAGALSLLGKEGLGVVGSREVGADAAEVTSKVGHLVAAAGLVLVSGGAKGVDAVGMSAAYDGGGAVVGVLADSLERAIGRVDNRRALLDGRACLCTPYAPDARFSVGAAMGRNKIIYGLSRATLVVVCAEGTGGTWAGATEALKKGYGQVAVWMGDGAGPGNDALVRAGGVAIGRLDALLELSAGSAPATKDPRGQMSLLLEQASTGEAS